MAESANEKQVGGTHYKQDDEATARALDLGYNKAVEHWDFARIRDYNYFQGNASKYLDRYDKKGTPIQDLKMSMHYIQKLIEIEQARLDREESLRQKAAEVPVRRRRQ